MKKIALVFLFMILLAGSSVNTASAQCAMCTINAEQGVKNGNTQAKGLNTGVIYLMAIPYTLLAGVGLLWYFRFHRRSAKYAKNV